MKDEKLCDSNNDCGNWEDEMKRGNEGKITDRGGRKTIKEVNKNTALLRKTGIIVFLLFGSRYGEAQTY